MLMARVLNCRQRPHYEENQQEHVQAPSGRGREETTAEKFHTGDRIL